MITNLIMESNIQDQYTYEKMNIFLISIRYKLIIKHQDNLILLL